MGDSESLYWLVTWNLYGGCWPCSDSKLGIGNFSYQKTTRDRLSILAFSLLKFLRFEGKASLDGKGEPLSSFEYELYNTIHAKLEAANLTIEEKVLAGLVLDEIDSYDGSFIKVTIKYNFFE